MAVSALDQRTPILAGLHAARANLAPGLVLQAFLLAIVIGYYTCQPMRAVLGEIARVKHAYSFLFSIVSAATAGGVIPQVLTVLFFQRGRIYRANLGNLAFNAAFCGYSGFIVDLFYRGQALWFGNEITTAVVVKKVLVDQLLLTPLYGAPVVVLAYDWKNSGFCAGAFTGVWSWTFYRNRVIPMILANWSVWIPVVALIYSLPLLLQVPTYCLALAFWILMVTYMSKLKETPASQSQPR